MRGEIVLPSKLIVKHQFPPELFFMFILLGGVIIKGIILYVHIIGGVSSRGAQRENHKGHFSSGALPCFIDITYLDAQAGKAAQARIRAGRTSIARRRRSCQRRPSGEPCEAEVARWGAAS